MSRSESKTVAAVVDPSPVLMPVDSDDSDVGDDASSSPLHHPDSSLPPEVNHQHLLESPQDSPPVSFLSRNPLLLHQHQVTTPGLFSLHYRLYNLSLFSLSSLFLFSVRSFKTVVVIAPAASLLLSSTSNSSS